MLLGFVVRVSVRVLPLVLVAVLVVGVLVVAVLLVTGVFVILLCANITDVVVVLLCCSVACHGDARRGAGAASTSL